MTVGGTGEKELALSVLLVLTVTTCFDILSVDIH